MSPLSFQSWAAQVLPASPLPGVVAYNFNIVETFSAFEVEVVGSSHFDPQSSDWGCEEAWTSRPMRYVALYAEAGRSWEQLLKSAAASVKEFVSTELPGAETLLRCAEAVTVGFVDGELVQVVGRHNV